MNKDFNSVFKEKKEENQLLTKIYPSINCQRYSKFLLKFLLKLKGSFNSFQALEKVTDKPSWGIYREDVLHPSEPLFLVPLALEENSFTNYTSDPKPAFWRRAQAECRELQLQRGQYLHTVPGSQVFVDDLPSGKVAHPTGNLDGHMHQILLGNRLQEPRAAAISPCRITGFALPFPFPFPPPMNTHDGASL